MTGLPTNARSLEQIAAIVDGKLLGDTATQIHAIADIKKAGASDISFLSSEKYLSALNETKAGCLLLKEAHAEAFEGNKIIVDDPYYAYAQLSAIFDLRVPQRIGVSELAFVHESAVLGEGVAIGPGCYVGQGVCLGDNVELSSGVYIGDRSTIGSDVILFPNVVIYHDVQLGDRVRIHANTTIGSDGFGFAPHHGKWQKIHQNGRVVIGSDVEIGANSAIDRGAIGDTRIEDNVIIDNQVHIAHNVVIGEATAIAGCVGIAGSTVIGKNCIIAGAVAINGHLDIADGTHFHGGTVVTRGNSEAGAFASTSPMQDVVSWRRNSVRMRQLDTLFTQVKKLEKAIDPPSDD